MCSAILELSGVSKSYGAVKALSDVSFSVNEGEVHAILGENGAGKSTALKIIKGEISQDEGTVAIAGCHTNAEERTGGDIAMVHQELAVFENMSVAENIFVGDMPRTGTGKIDFRRMHDRAAELLSLFGLQLDSRQLLSELTPGQQQIVEILRAIQSDASLLILDEPTSGLNNHEARLLLRLIVQMKSQGHTILYVSHRLHEVLEIADSVTVLRDGKYVDTSLVENLTEDDLVRRMVGRELEGSLRVRQRSAGDDTGDPVFEIRGLGMSGAFSDIDFAVSAGEIVGVFGLEGSGAEELSRAIFGITGTTEGHVAINGQPFSAVSPPRLMRGGVSYLNGNRKDAGLYMDRSVADNICATVLDHVSRHGFVDQTRIENTARSQISRFSIRVSSISDRPYQLSGGNQQKVMFSACLASRPDILILNEPTRGVDVGAKADVHDVIVKLAEQGKAAIVFSSDLPELLRLSDRIVVMRNRSMAGEVDGSQLNEEEIMLLAAGSA